MYVQFIPTYSTYSRLLQPHRSDLNLQLKQSHLRIGISSPKTSIMVAAAYTHQLYFVTAADRRDGMGIDSAEVHVGVEAEIRMAGFYFRVEKVGARSLVCIFLVFL